MQRLAFGAGKYATLAVMTGLLIPSVARADEFRCGGSGASVSAAIPPSLLATANINGALTNVSQCIITDGKQSSLTATIFSPFATVEIRALMNADPFITFGATTTNLIPGPTTFAFLFGTPIVPGLYSAATSTGGVSVTDGAGGSTTVATSAIYPKFISGYGTLGLVPTNLGVDLGTSPCVASGLPFTVTTTCNQGSTSSTFAPTLYDNLEALLTYTQNDTASIASWSGAVTIGTAPPRVPEPTSLTLVATGALLTLVQFARRRRH